MTSRDLANYKEGELYGINHTRSALTEMAKTADANKKPIFNRTGYCNSWRFRSADIGRNYFIFYFKKKFDETV
ncbi:MAG: hypothetical protein CM1200mP10_02430 [Candidatus Neomarinimicrobiota bacterium]|nr:MAG: hypothetical protein CM1200mP10_02430 [Candidatus Neomarinimicrobiota bacterium]